MGFDFKCGMWTAQYPGRPHNESQTAIVLELKLCVDEIEAKGKNPTCERGELGYICGLIRQLEEGGE